MKKLLSPPTLEDLILLLRAWRLWVLGALVGALIGAAFFYLFPPPYRAKATVNVDFNLEQAWPQDTDRQQFYYLEREARKLEEIAWSDDVMSQVSSEFGISVADLRGEKLQLSQPAEAGWHFYADDQDPEVAGALASAWAAAFTARSQAEVEAGNVNEFVRFDATQTKDLPKERSVSLSDYLLAGSAGLLTLAVFFVLFISPRNS